jgi:peptidoglycan/LPS O-acetylase OafA/YrhL
LVLWLTWVTTGSASWATAALACCAIVAVVEVSYRLLEVPALGKVRSALEPRVGQLSG